MEIVTIIIIGLIALAIQITYERRRTANTQEFEKKRFEQESKSWADILASARTVNQTIETLKTAMTADEQYRKNEKERHVSSLLDAERQRRAEGIGNGWPSPEYKPAPVGKMDGYGVWRENGQPTAWYDANNDQWKDRSGQVVPDPRPLFKRMEMADRLFSNPDICGVKVADPRTVGARISAVDMAAEPDRTIFHKFYTAESEMESQARRATQSVMMDAIATGTGGVRISTEGVEHIPAADLRGGGGSFDGGGASSDFTSAPSSSDSSSPSND